MWDKLCARPGVVLDFECSEPEAHALFTQAEREVLGEQLERLDVDVPTVMIRRASASPDAALASCYSSAVGGGSLEVERTLCRVGL